MVSNAIKFTPQKGLINIFTKELEDSVQITIADTGIGISSEDIDKLFRIDINNLEIGNSKEKGTGIGLILCKEFIQRHGGKIWVESSLGKGSSFSFTIPK